MDRRRPHRIPARPLVLIVDDDEDTRAMYAFALSASGFDVAVADSTVDPFNRITEMLPDIILAALESRGGDEWALLGVLKHDPRTVEIPVVVLTSRSAKIVRERAEREGCAALCVKPCLPDVLAVGLRAVLERYSRV